MTNVYQVTVEGNVSEVATIAEVKSLIGDTKVTKKAIENGEYPMVTIATEPAMDLEEDTATEEVEVDEPTTDEVDEDTTEEDTTDEVDEDDTEEDTVDEPTSDLPAEYVVGAMAIISDDSTNEELLEWIFEADLPKDEVTITAVDKESGNIEVKGYDGAVHYTDLTVTAPPKAKTKTRSTANTPNPDVDGYPEVGYFAEENDMKKYIKKLSYEQLEEWCNQAGAEYNTHDNPSINRMRMAMAIKAKHFTHLAPGNGKSKSSKKSKYAQYTNEDLAQLCLDNDIEVRDAKGDARIERMYMITDLRKANIIE